MYSVAEKLAAHWSLQGMTLARETPLARIKEFEQRYNVSLPSDMRNYFLRVDGMAIHSITSYQDKQGFSFWPLSRVKPAAEEASAHPVGYWDFPDQNALFLFADYLDWSWAYAIRLSRRTSPENPVFTVGKKAWLIKVADSFSEFVDLYIEDSPLLY